MTRCIRALFGGVHLEDITGKFRGRVVEVNEIQGKAALPDWMKSYKGYTEEGVAFNRDHIPPTYEVTLQNKKGRQREFLVETNLPPEMGSEQTFRVNQGRLRY